MNAVFLDTGYLLALELSNDSNHQAAQQHWMSVRHALPQLVTTSFVFDEVVTYFNSRRRHDKVVEIGQMLLTSPTVELVFVDQMPFRDGWDMMLRHSDKAWSLPDCIFVCRHAAARIDNRVRLRPAL
jgi:predicted nucleic acid-binding protein